MSTLVPERIARGPGSGNDGPTRVIVLNDAVNSFDHVIETFQRVMGWSGGKSQDVAMAIHVNGRATVFEGHGERAEHVHGQLSSAGLTLEPLS